MVSEPMAAIVGYGDVYATDEEPKPPIVLAADAIGKAAEDAGLEPDDLRGNGLLTARRPAADHRPQWNNVLASYLNLAPRYTSEVTFHSAGAIALVEHATSAVREGDVDYVVCAGADAAASLGAYPHFGSVLGKYTNYTEFAGTMDIHPEFEYPYGIIMPAAFAMVARRQIAELGHTEEDFALGSVICRDWAVDNPLAVMGGKGRITVDDVLESRMIASPIRLLNIMPLGPAGRGGAWIVTSVERAEELVDEPIYVHGYGGRATHENFTPKLNSPFWGERGNLIDSGLRDAADRAYEMAGVTPEAIDLLETEAGTSNMIPLSLEELGLCERGEGGRFIREGHLDPDGGDIAFCTDGGALSAGQPGVSLFIDRVIETIRQLRGEPIGRQAEGVETGIVYGSGGPLFATNAVAILGNGRDPR